MLAKVNNGFAPKRETVAINGAVRPLASGNVSVSIKIAGKTRKWTAPEGSPHRATYGAAISAMIDADADGVTHLTLQTPANLVRRQATGTFKCIEPDLQTLLAICTMFEADFDDVDWIKGPA